MNTSTAALAFALLLAQQTASQPRRDQKPVASVRNAVVAGHVVDAETDTPIAHAVVEVWSKGPGARRIAVETGARGEFRVVDLPTGAYRIVASPPDFHATHASEELTVDRARDDLRIALPRALALEGRVVDETGEPMPGVMVSAVGVGELPPDPRETDDRGFFRVFGLRPGTYGVCATPSRTGRAAGARRLRGTPYLTTCYPSAPAGGGERVAVDGTPGPPLTIVMQRLPGFAISGRVTSESSNPQLQVTIVRLGQSASGVIPVNLQPGGVFKAQGLPPGRYLVHANAGTVAIPALEAAAVERAYRIVDLTTGNVAGLELVMKRTAAATIAQDLAVLKPETPPAPVHSNEDPPPPAEDSTKPRRLAISGRVADENGNPLAGITVAVVSRYRGGGSAGRIFPQTDDRGSFRLFDLPPGRHAVCASPGRPLPFEADAPRRSVYVSTCFPHVTHAADAIQVTLTDHDVEGLDIRLQRRAVYAVTGQILSADGQVAPPALIEAIRIDTAAPVSYAGSIQRTGSFRLTNLLPGGYLVLAASLPARNAPQDPQWGATRVDVTSADVDGVVLQLKRSVSVKGLVTFEDPPPGPLRLKVQTRWADAGSRPAPSPAAVVADDGTFELEGLFGPVVISMQAESAVPYVVSALRHRGRDVTDTALEIDGSPGESLEIVLTNRTATIAGVVRDSRGPVVAGAAVLCFPIDSQRWAHFAPCRAKVSSDGSWKLPSLVAGEYHVVALSAEDAESLVLPADYAAVARFAERVKLQPRDVRTLDLRLVPLGR